MGFEPKIILTLKLAKFNEKLCQKPEIRKRGKWRSEFRNEILAEFSNY